LITHALTEKAMFLGYDISADGPGNRGKGHGSITLRVPIKKLREKIQRYQKNGKPVHRPELINESDFAIIEKYGSEYRGIVQYYAYARNRWWFNHLHRVMEVSLYKTLARKHKSTVSKIARRFAGKTFTGRGLMKCVSVTILRKVGRPIYAQFGGIDLRKQSFKNVEIEDVYTDRDRMIPRCELLDRLKSDKCELCGSMYNVEVHHIRKLSDLNVKGRKAKPTWLKTMVAMRRKTLIVCRECHDAIHAGRPTRTHEIQDESFHRIESPESRVL
jgi:hypothetical protein